MKKFLIPLIIVLFFCCSTLFANIPSSFYNTGLGINSGDDESYTLTANWSVPSDTVVMIGGEGKGTIIQTGGTAGTFQIISMGYAQGGEGYWTQSGGAVNAIAPIIGSGGIGVFTQNAGTNSFTFMGIGQRNLNYPTAMGGCGEYQLNGGTLTTGRIFLGSDETQGNFVMTGGTLMVTETYNPLQSMFIIEQGYGSFTMTGGMLKTLYTPQQLTNLFETTIQHTGEVVIGTEGQYTTAYIVPESTSILLLGIGLLIQSRILHKTRSVS